MKAKKVKSVHHKVKHTVKQKHNVGLILIGVGLVVWTLPFIIIAINNLTGNTKPGDYLANNLGITLITISPALIIIGLFLLVERYAKERRHN